MSALDDDRANAEYEESLRGARAFGTGRGDRIGGPRRTVKEKRALEREWDARLAASGFRDLEGRDRDGPLSDRGNLHVVSEGDGQQERLAERIEHGAAYNTWAEGVLRTHRFASTLQRDVWAHHARGEGLRSGAAKSLGVPYQVAREAVLAVKAAVRDQADPGNQGKEQICGKPSNLRQLLRRSDSGVLLKLAQVLLRARPA